MLCSDITYMSMDIYLKEEGFQVQTEKQSDVKQRYKSESAVVKKFILKDEH